MNMSPIAQIAPPPDSDPKAANIKNPPVIKPMTPPMSPKMSEASLIVFDLPVDGFYEALR
ncbi:MAG: hypothetical protein HSCHL_2576 [Hydrogenibacillus schlegelii]|uniref:Uncharacterized protein n=1 Tax=Hydrogenibacillus schlegelii TaxID=1484 RepID=A0A2T5G3N7_HYDSH|nr:MAG: hypothetical protein HSCHL_2576 [Hydrogenibacillus schlegelii]